MSGFRAILKRFEIIPNVDRPITEREVQGQLHQRQIVEIEPNDTASVIQLNSTYLDIVDIGYGWRGILAAGGVILAPSVAKVGYSGIHGFITLPMFANANGLFTAGFLFVGLLYFGLVITALAMLFYEAFRCTHFPIRFNRKNRMVYVFRRDGTVLSASWDELFFRLREPRSEGRDYLIEGYVLDQDRVTVREIFRLGYTSSETYNMYLHWEYIRRYMEAGPAEVFDHTERCLPIWDRRESPAFGFWRLLYNFNGNIVHQTLLSPFFFVFSLGRIVAMWTSRIPQWPKEVEEACAVEPNDPFARDWRMNDKPYLFFFGRKKAKA